MTRNLVVPVAAALALARVAAAQDTQREQPDFTGRVTVEEQYDDNINFADGDANPELDDFVTRIRPFLQYRHPFEDHLFTGDFSGDLRRGLDTDLSEFNATGAIRLDLKFAGGLSVRLGDVFTHSSFDQAIFNEPGTTDSDANDAGVRVEYTKVDRLSLSARFNHFDQNFNTATGDRTVDSFGAHAGVPVHRRLVAYGDFAYLDQDSPTRIERRYDDQRVAGGLRFQGAARFTVFGEAGWQRIRYEAASQPDFDNPVGLVGVEVKVSDETSARAAVGKDGYEGTVFDVSLLYSKEGDHEFQLILSRSTKDSFSASASGSIYQGTTLALRGKTRAGAKVTLGGEGSYFLYRPVADNAFTDSDTGTIRGWALYELTHWLSVGGSYQYAHRTSDDVVNEYSLNRVGATVQLEW